MTLGEFRRATTDLPDEAVLNVGAAGSYLTWSVSSVTSSVTGFTAPVPETVFANLTIDVDWETLAAYAVLRTVDDRAFQACLHEMRSRGLVIDSLDRAEMEKLLGERVPEEDWRRFARCCHGKDCREGWAETWTRFRDDESRSRKLMESMRRSNAEGEGDDRK